jgi:hypothetical protein
MFYDGYPDKGHCAAGGGHVANGPDILLNHNVPPTVTQQPEWRYCSQCHGLFYDGYPNKGHCPAGGGHLGQGSLDYVLAHAPDGGHVQFD